MFHSSLEKKPDLIKAFDGICSYNMFLDAKRSLQVTFAVCPSVRQLYRWAPLAPRSNWFFSSPEFQTQIAPPRRGRRTWRGPSSPSPCRPVRSRRTWNYTSDTFIVIILFLYCIYNRQLFLLIIKLLLDMMCLLQNMVHICSSYGLFSIKQLS